MWCGVWRTIVEKSTVCMPVFTCAKDLYPLRDVGALEDAWEEVRREGRRFSDADADAGREKTGPGAGMGLVRGSSMMWTGSLMSRKSGRGQL